MTHVTSLRPARPDDYRAIADLLSGAQLPIVGIESHLSDFVVAESGTSIVGCAGLERYGTAALLRSVAVVERFRGTGLGQRLTAACLAAARASRIETVVLLTETADGFFPRFGFRVVPRTELPKSVQESTEFRGVCSSTARAMILDLASDSP